MKTPGWDMQDINATEIETPWRKLSPTREFEIIHVSENLMLEIKRNGREVTISIFREEKEKEEHIFILGKDDFLNLGPILPDLPLVIKPQTKLSIFPGKRLDVFIEVPLLLEVFVGKKQQRHTLLEIPIQNLSKSFFGSPDSGEVAYSIESPLFQNVSSYSPHPFLGYCPVHISNKSSQLLNFERMILRGPTLSLFNSGTNIYTSPISIIFKGQDQISQMSIDPSPLKTENESILVAKPRNPIDKSLIKKSFYFMKNIYNG